MTDQERLRQIRKRVDMYGKEFPDYNGADDTTNGFNIARISMQLRGDGYAEGFVELASHSIADMPFLLSTIASITTERDAAIQDLHMLSDLHKFCETCKYNNGSGVRDCGKYDCDEKNLYEWRGVCTDNGGK